MKYFYAILHLCFSQGIIKYLCVAELGEEQIQQPFLSLMRAFEKQITSNTFSITFYIIRFLWSIILFPIFMQKVERRSYIFHCRKKENTYVHQIYILCITANLIGHKCHRNLIIQASAPVSFAACQYLILEFYATKYNITY